MALGKRKRVAVKGAKAAAPKKKAPEVQAHEDAHLESDDDVSSEGAAPKQDSDDEEAFFETPDEKRVRVAKEYLAKLADVPQPDGVEGRTGVQEQLNKDVEDQAKRSRVQVGEVTFGEKRLHQRGHRSAVTCVALTEDDSTAWTGGKDCAVTRWDVETGKKVIFPGGKNRFECGGHFDKVYGVALIEPRQLVASVGEDRLVRLWDSRAPMGAKNVQTLQGHQGAITGVAAEADGSHLYTASMDKSLKIWDLRTKRCMDTVFGHVAGATCMDLYNKSRPVTGGIDKTVRLWKIDRETHLMFNRHTYSVDAVTVCDADRVLSGSQDGSLMLWSLASKKPLATGSIGAGKWVTCLRAIRRSNVAFSGGADGLLRTWRFARGGGDEEDKSLKLAECRDPVQLPGCINAIAVGRKVIACALGKEHRLGSWEYDKTQKNGLLLMPMSYTES